MAMMEERLKGLADRTYNTFNLEIIKLFRLLLNFGMYENQGSNDFLTVLRHLVMLFEFEKNYPEGQILLDRARRSFLNFFSYLINF